MPVYDIGITEINTQVRRLGYASAILSILGSRTMNEVLLYERLQKWSADHEAELLSYVNPQGQIKPTRMKSGAKNYTEFVVSLGLVGRIAGACRVTRFGKVVTPFICSSHKDNHFVLGPAEKYSYLYWLFIKDADRLMTVLNMLGEEQAQPFSNLQRNFQSRYLQFLDARQATAENRIAGEILSFRNSVARTWKNPRRYAESIVPPRVNWLVDIGLASFRTRDKSACLTEGGAWLLRNMPKLGDSKLGYISQTWARNWFFEFVGPVVSGQTGKRWRELPTAERREHLRVLTGAAFETLRTTPTPKVTLQPVMLYIALRLACEHQVWLDLDELLKELRELSTKADGDYEVRFSYRENESYLIRKLN